MSRISNCVILVIGEVIIDVCLFITCFDPEVIFLDKIPTIGAIILMIGSIIYTIKVTIDTIRAKRAFIPILENYYSWYTFYDPDHKYFGSDVIKKAYHYTYNYKTNTLTVYDESGTESIYIDGQRQLSITEKIEKQIKQQYKNAVITGFTATDLTGTFITGTFEADNGSYSFFWIDNILTVSEVNNQTDVSCYKVCQ